MVQEVVRTERTPVVVGNFPREKSSRKTNVLRLLP